MRSGNERDTRLSIGVQREILPARENLCWAQASRAEHVRTVPYRRDLAVHRWVCNQDQYFSPTFAPWACPVAGRDEKYTSCSSYFVARHTDELVRRRVDYGRAEWRLRARVSIGVHCLIGYTVSLSNPTGQRYLWGRRVGTTHLIGDSHPV